MKSSGIRFLLFTVVACAGPATAMGQVTGLYVTDGVPAGGGAVLDFDLKRNGQVVRGQVGFGTDYNPGGGFFGGGNYGGGSGFGGSSGPLGVPGPGAINSGEMANAIADAINRAAGIEIADSSGGKVKVKPGWELSIDKGTTKNGFKLTTAKPQQAPPVPPKIPATFSLAPDFQSFESALTEEGAFGVEGPLGLSSFFTAPAGTTSVELAALFANSLNTVSDYEAVAVGSEVRFMLSSTEDVLFTVDGAPLEYAVSSVPEPAALASFALGGACWLFWARRTRRAFARQRA